MPVTRFEELVAWQKAKLLSLEVYRATAASPFYQDFALRDQIRRATISVMSNIAEGFGRYGKKEFLHFLSIARGSVSEVRCQIDLAHALGYVSAADFQRISDLSIEVSRLVSSLHRTNRS